MEGLYSACPHARNGTTHRNIFLKKNKLPLHLHLWRVLNIFICFLDHSDLVALKTKVMVFGTVAPLLPSAQRIVVTTLLSRLNSSRLFIGIAQLHTATLMMMKLVSTIAPIMSALMLTSVNLY